MQNTSTQVNTQNQSLTLHSACGDFDDEVTPELMRSLGFEVHTDEKGDFCPISEREYSLVNQNDILTVGSKSEGVIRFLRLSLINGQKYLNISDDDYSAADTVERTLNNYKNSRAAFQKMAKAFDVELSDFRVDNDDGTISEYELDIDVPLTRFDAIQSGKQLAQFFETCSFDTPESINEAIETVVGKQ